MHEPAGFRAFCVWGVQGDWDSKTILVQGSGFLGFGELQVGVFRVKCI